MKDFLEEIGINIAFVLAGLAGSLVTVSNDATKNLKSSVAGIIAGTFSANYLTQVVVEVTGLNGKTEYGLAFILGYIGLKGVEKISRKVFNEDGSSSSK
jgi:hypothetical protein